MARNEDIPVIFFNREPVREDLMQWEKLYYVGCDAEQSVIMQGEIAAEYINSHSEVDKNKDGKIQYVLLEGEAGHQDAISRTEYSVKTSFHSRWIISSIPDLTCNISFLIISHWRRLSENCAGYIMNKRLSEKYM